MFGQNDLTWASFYYQYFGPVFHIPSSTFRNELEAFQHIWNTTKTVRTDPTLWIKKEKWDESAEEYKLLGNHCYKSKEYGIANRFYLTALCFADTKGVTYGKILSNLALVRYFQGMYQQCIELITMCEKTEYPKNNFPKLQIRKIRAWKKLGDDRKATETFPQLKKMLHSLKLDESERKKFLDEANEALKEILDEKLKNKCDEKLIVPEMEGNLTSKAEIRKGGVRGTIVQATENIKLGEPILVEQMNSTNIIKFCSNCYKPNEVPHTCESCSFVMYCSESCKKSDQETHKLQCTLYQTKVFAEILEFIHEPFIIFTKGATLNGFHDFKAFSKDFVTFGKTLVSCSIVVYYIMQNRHILETLQRKKIVRSGLNAKRTACEIGKKLLELAVILKFNREPHADRQHEVFSFFPQYMSFGHSCAPNTSKYLSGNKIVVKAAEDIEAGQEITVAYGNFLYSNLPHAIRQEELQMYYGFKCRCKACQNLHFETVLTGVIKCERCGFYMRFGRSGFIFCDNCQSVKWPDSEMREIAKLLSYESRTSIGRQELMEYIERFKELEINPSNDKVVTAQFMLAKDDIDHGNVENGMKIVVRSNALKGPFNNYVYHHHVIFRSLQTYLKTLHSSASRHHIAEKISIEAMDMIEKFLNAFESLINLYYPKREILGGIEEFRNYLSIIKKIRTIYLEADKFVWNIVDDDKELHNSVQMRSY